MKVTINGKEDWFQARLIMGSMGQGMDSASVGMDIKNAIKQLDDDELNAIFMDLFERDHPAPQGFNLHSYLLGFKAGESYVRSQF